MHECKNMDCHTQLIYICILHFFQEDACHESIGDDECENTSVEDPEEQQQVRSTKRPTGSKEKKTSKRQKETEDIILHKAIDLMEQSSSKPISRDVDDIFGEYVANELKTIKDGHLKRMVKFNIQSILFHSLTQPSMPQMSASQMPTSHLMNTSQMPTSHPMNAAQMTSMNASQMHGSPVSPWNSSPSSPLAPLPSLGQRMLIGATYNLQLTVVVAQEHRVHLRRIAMKPHD